MNKIIITERTKIILNKLEQSKDKLTLEQKEELKFLFFAVKKQILKMK